MVGFTQSRAGAVVLAVVVVSVAATQADTIFVDTDNCPLSDCCFPHNLRGCDDRECEAIVCAVIPNCCAGFAVWFQGCADLAFDLCGLCRPSGGSGTEADPYCSIQTAIDNAVDTDEIVVAPGTYIENIDFLGKAITLRSSDGADVTTIGPPAWGDVVRCISGEGPDTLLDGFTITGEEQFGPYGHGMFNSGSSPTVSNCIFRDNSTLGYGGGMSNNSSSPTVTNCTFSGNSATAGGGMYNIFSSPTVINCTFSGNSANSGGGMANAGGTPTVTNCTFSGNSASSSGGGMSNSSTSPTVTNCTFESNTGNLGGGMYSQVGSSPTMTNCTFSGNTAVNAGGLYNAGGTPTLINCTLSGNSAESGVGGLFSFGGNPTLSNCVLWGNGPSNILNNGGSPVVTFTDVQGGFPGLGNIDADPLFVDPGNGDHRLSPGSLCIDAGDNTAVPQQITTDLDGNPRFRDDPGRPDGGVPDGVNPIIDMGSYEFQGESTPGDLNGDGTVGINDFSALLDAWGPCPDPCPPFCFGDIDGDCNVGVLDFLLLLRNWTL